MQKISSIAKKALLMITASAMTMTVLTGCGDLNEIEGSLNTCTAGMNERFSDTNEIAQSLKNSGFISSSTCDTITQNTADLADEITKMNAGVMKKENEIKDIHEAHDLIQDTLMVDGAEGKSIYKAISALRPLGGLKTSNYNVYPGDDKIYGTDGEAEDFVKDGKGTAPLKWSIISNYIMADNDSDGDLDLWKIPKSMAKKHVENNEWLCANVGIAKSGISCQGGSLISGLTDGSFECHPIEIVPSSLADELNSKFEYEVYVLDPDLYQNYGNSSDGYNNSFDAMAADIQDALNSKNTTTLDKYFKQAKTTSGSPVTLRTILNDNGVSDKQIDNLVCDSQFYTTKGNSLDLEMTGEGDNQQVAQYKGHDILVTQKEDGSDTPIGVMQIRVQEFNYETAEMINSVLGIFSNESMNSRYMVIQNDSVGGRVYLVEYPVYSMSGLEVTSSTGSAISATPSYALSGIGINFAQGHIVNYEEVNGVLTYESTVAGKNWGYEDTSSDLTNPQKQLNDIDMYYTSSLFGDDPKNSSFVVAGKTGLAMGLDGKRFKVGTSEKTIQKDVSLNCPRIVLRDYIEATYAPEFNNDVNIAAFGRKVRLSVTEYINSSGKIVYPNNEPIAFYVDQAGNKLPTTSFLKLSDLCDIDALTNNNKVKKIVASGKQPGTTQAVEKTTNSKPLMSELECTTVGTVGSSVNPFTMFPGPKIATDDYATFEDGHIRQRMWAICVYGGVYDTELLTDWVDSTDPVASLDWWNQFLEDNGYGYYVSKTEIINYINKEYASQIASVTGDVIISLDTIKDIDDIYEKEDNARVASVIRTTFLIVGWIIMLYSLLLMLCWVLDTNTDIGIGLMEKVTFGHWTAVKYAGDVPEGDTGERSYLAFGSLMLRCVILIVVGILLINVDIFALVSTLVGLFGKAASAIEDLIKGN